MALNKFIKVGLTGGIGSGKSTVADILRKEGISIVDADIISRDILKSYPEINSIIMREFGKKFFDGGVLDRRKLGNFIFRSTKERKKLEDIMIPYIKKQIFMSIERYEKEGREICVLDAPTLIEHGLNKLMDFNIVVWVDKKTQVERVKKRDILSDKEVLDRINSQMPLDEKIDFADFVIDNSGSVEETEAKVKEILHSIK